MNVTIVDYQSGNISSVINSFTEVAKGKVNLEVTSDINKIKSCDKIVLPGQGSFKSCVDSLNQIKGLVDTLKEFAITNKSHMYFVHSYEFIPEDKSVISATTDYSSKIVCSIERHNLFGTQFHPEKSDKTGLKIIDNFIKL